MSVQPRFSIISAVHDVARYLPDFIASVEAQDFDLDRVQVVMVDDGSHDDSLVVLQAWAARRPTLVTVLHQENAGQGAARNAGLSVAVGEWVTFPDPDDVLDGHYLRTVDAFLTEHPDAALVAANRLIWTEATGELANTHPLHRFFSYDRLADLDVNETSFHGSAPAAFFRLEVLREHALAFDDRIRPNFEDGHFTSLYLLHCARPLVGFLKSTSYHYRKRADASSSLARSMVHPGRFTDVFEFGYLAILDAAVALRGAVPRWLQHFLAYELLGYVSAYQWGRMTVDLDGPEIAAFHRNMAAVLGRLDLAHVLDRLELPSQPQLRLVLEHGYADQPWVDDHVYVDELDPDQKLARVRYYFTGAPPAEEVWSGEQPVGPRHAKTRDLEYYGRTLLHERVLWVRYFPDVRIRINGAWAPLHFERPVEQWTRAFPRRLRRLVGRPSRVERQRVAALSPTPTTAQGRKARALADKPRTRARFADAWVLVDRVHNAGDSAEILFRRLRSEHPAVNAWFTVEKGTPDWVRLRREFGSRVVAHGSTEWIALMVHCAVLLSSHADVPIVKPPAVLEVTAPTWKFVFLQHGVIKDDLNSWLGTKKIDLFVTSTPGELASVAGDGTSYPFTTKEVKLTGLPRFDRLLETARRFPPDRQDLVLIAPTWREWLVAGLAPGSQRRTLDDEVLASDFVQQWLAVLTSPELARACAEHGTEVGFLPHPNLQALLDRLDLPDHVVALPYEGVDVQEYFARARVLVTDYSSIAFNAAYLDRPVVYFQFDAERIARGGHVGRPGYFSYTEDGFGPVTTTAAGAVAATAEALAHGSPSTYRSRVAATFPQRDGHCSDRVIEAVLALGKPDT